MKKLYVLLLAIGVVLAVVSLGTVIANAATVVPTPTPTPAPTPKTTATATPGPASCAFYPSQAVAQAAYDAHPIILASLDTNHTGVACPDNPPPYDPLHTPTKIQVAVTVNTASGPRLATPATPAADPPPSPLPDPPVTGSR